MPELPDVERFKMYLDATSLHQEIAATEVHDNDILDGISVRKLRSHLQGESFEATSRHGKFLFVHLQPPRLLVLHFGMTGYLDYAHKDECPRHARVVFRFEGGSRLAYVCQRKLGRVAMTDNRDEFLESQQLGPDALDEHLTARELAERIAGRRSATKSAIMDQSIIAGVGNIYADEILFQAGIAPDRCAAELDEKDLRTLHRAMRRVLQTAIRNRTEVARFPKTYLLRRRDQDGSCPKCSHKLKTTRISGRRAVFCPHCQQ